jgi:ubiquinone biosynthesis protein
MPDAPDLALAPPPEPAPALPAQPTHRPPIVLNPLRPYRGVVRRFFVVYRHVLGLLGGGMVAYVRALPPDHKRGLHALGPRFGAFVVRPFLDREILALPYPAQLRRRLELLGPTYIKLGQILAIREDILPRIVTRELQNLFDRLPAVPFDVVRGIIERSLGRPLGAVFASVEDPPIGSASIAQAHRARLITGESVVVKVIKPGVSRLVRTDLQLLRAVGRLLELVIPRYQPRQIIAEFSAYTIKEIDYAYEADNAEMFAANFADMPEVVFPRIYREASSTNVLTMELLDGFKPSDPRALALTEEERARLIDLGAASIVRMLYQDGFFHADLHAGNLMILPAAAASGESARLGFIDLGMVGRFSERTRRRMLHYFHALVTGDVEGATQHLADLAQAGPGGDLAGFSRAVADLSRRFVAQSRTGDFSIAQLILESVGLGARYRVAFPVEMTLMVKALVTFEGVGRMLDPRLDVASVAETHVSRVFRHTFNPQQIARELWRSAPEMLDLLSQLPRLAGAGFRAADAHLNGPPRPNPLAGLKGAILSGACIVAAALVVVQHGPLALSIGLFVLAVLLYAFGG